MRGLSIHGHLPVKPDITSLNRLLGRLLNRSDDDHPGASDAAVLSFSTWKNDFNRDPNVVGKMVRINKHPYTVVGVTPEGFYGTEKMGSLDIFVPMANEAFRWNRPGEMARVAVIALLPSVSKTLHRTERKGSPVVEYE